MAQTDPRSKLPVPDPGEDEARLGQVIDGRYRLDRLLGRGGMGVVYRAEHVAIRRTLAVKLLHPSLAAIPELRSRFEREAIAIGRIDHPNCVGVSDFGRLDDGTLFLVMELLDGRSLGDVLDAEAPIEPARALRILRHVLAGLGHAHGTGIVHRDVKPENVYLVPVDGDPEFAKILDFGIAKVIAGGEVADDVKLTQAGVAFGTPVYMSPEQALGNPLDGRSDLYGASVMAYEMLCGRPPFWADDKLEILSMHTTRPPPDMNEMLQRVRTGVTLPQPIIDVILKGLAKRKEERWQTAGEYISAVEELLDQLGDNTQKAWRAPTGASPLTTGATPVATALGPRPGPSPSTPILLTHRRRPTTGVTSRRAIGAVALVGAAALGVLLALLLREPARPTGPKLDPTTPAGKAAALLDRGKAGEAIKTIEAAKKQTASDPVAQLVLGHAYAAQRKNAEAVAAYKRSLDLDAGRATDEQLRANLRTIGHDTDVDAAIAALGLLAGRASDASARKQLVELAASADPARRKPAATLAEKLGLGHEVKWLDSYLYDLAQGDVCAQRKEAVAKLRALGDPKAVPGLEKALFRKGTVGKWKGKNVNDCLVDDARAAITYLQSVKP